MFSDLFNWSNTFEAMSRAAADKVRKDAEVAQPEYAQPEYAQPEYIPQSYAPFSQSFQQQQRPPVADIYQRGAMPNDLLARYNSMAQMLQQQQAAMVPRTQPTAISQGQAPFVSRPRPNQYTNFAQLFGGRNG